MKFVKTDDPAGAAANAAQAARTGRSCGTCSLCCKLLEIPEIEKPANVWCKDCRPGKGGCAIHDTKPAVCAGWYCAWMTQSSLGEHWNPRISKMVLNLALEDGESVLYVMVDPSFPFIWREPRYFEEILGLADNGLYGQAGISYLTKVCIGERTFAITPRGEAVEVPSDRAVWFDLELGTHELISTEELAERHRKQAQQP